MAQQHEIIRKTLQPAEIHQPVGVVEIQEITFPPGQTAPKHLHPCTVIGYVKSGTVLFQIEGKEPVLIKEGESFYESRNVTILHFDNASSDEEMTFVAFYLKENNEANVQLVS